MGKQELLPPRRNLPEVRTQPVSIVPTRVQPSDIISSTFMRWEANAQNKAMTAVAGRTRAEADLFEAHTQLAESYGRRQRALGHLEELPEIIENERAKRRVVRAESLRQTQHEFEVAETRRMTELTQVETVLVDAQQALKAQRDFGFTTYELAWKKKSCEMLDVELNAAERRAILRQHLGELDAPNERTAPAVEDDGDGALDDALLAARNELRAHGLDTSRIESLVERRRASR